MRSPRSRRALLTSAIPLVAALAGCSDEQVSSPDDPAGSGVVAGDAYDCAAIDRPEPDPPDRDDALEPSSYPSPPASVSDEAARYVLEFERAYRRNAFLAEFGSETRSFDFRFENRRTNEIESPSEIEAVLVAIVYTLSTETRGASGPPERDTRVTYYVDENVALRARYNGLADGPAFDPDPRTAGEPIACFD